VKPYGLSLLLVLLVLCCGCPGQGARDNTTGGGGPAGATTPAGTPSPSDATASTGEDQSASADAAEAPAERLELMGVYIGMPAAEFEALAPKGSGYTATVKWMSTNDVAMGLIKPDTGDELREASFAFGGVIMYTVTDKLDNDKFQQTVAELTKQFGTPTTDPPDFAAQHDFFKTFKADRANFLGVSFWVDEARRTLISATMWPVKDKMYFMLFNPDSYDSLHKRKMKTAAPVTRQ
jgi:hypothetical protein